MLGCLLLHPCTPLHTPLGSLMCFRHTPALFKLVGCIHRRRQALCGSLQQVAHDAVVPSTLATLAASSSHPQLAGTKAAGAGEGCCRRAAVGAFLGLSL